MDLIVSSVPDRERGIEEGEEQREENAKGGVSSNGRWK